MKATQSFGQLAALFLSLASVISAGDVGQPAMEALAVRQNQQSPTPTPNPKASSSSPAPTRDTANTHDLNNASLPPTSTKTGDKNATVTDAPKHTAYDPLSPAGAVTMIEPALTAGPQLYKVGDFVTWKWNYTNLLGTPTAIDVLASCSACSRTFTLTQNMTWATQNAFTWDTGDYQKKHSTAGLAVAQYTLMIYDADSGPSATIDPGYLGLYNSLQFGMYTGMYTDIPAGEDWSCASCSGAFSQMERRAIGFAMSMSIITVLSFTWFVTGFTSIL